MPENTTTASPESESIKVLRECIALQVKKGQDYQNPNSTIRQADHYPHGVQTIMDMVHQKIIRYRSLTESGEQPNFESIEDTLKDAINYLSFAVSYARGKMDGQDPSKDMFNKKKPVVASGNLMISSASSGFVGFGGEVTMDALPRNDIILTKE